MQKKYNLVFNRFRPLSHILLEDISQILATKAYSEAEGFGFKDIELHENILFATLLKRIPVSVSDYDSNLFKFISKTIYVYHEIPFCLDCQYELIYSFGSADNINRLKSALRNVLMSSYEYDEIHIKPHIIAEKLSNGNDYFEIREMVIKGFVYREGTIGKLLTLVTDQNVGRKLVSEYMENIYKITFLVDNEKIKDAEVTFSDLGAFVLKCDEEFFEHNLYNIKDIIFN